MQRMHLYIQENHQSNSPPLPTLQIKHRRHPTPLILSPHFPLLAPCLPRQSGIKHFIKCYTSPSLHFVTNPGKLSFCPTQPCLPRLAPPRLPSNPHLVCLLPEARIAASWQIVGGGRQGQLCLQARGGGPFGAAAAVCFLTVDQRGQEERL